MILITNIQKKRNDTLSIRTKVIKKRISITPYVINYTPYYLHNIDNFKK